MGFSTLDLLYRQKPFEKCAREGNDAFGEELTGVAGVGFVERLVAHPLEKESSSGKNKLVTRHVQQYCCSRKKTQASVTLTLVSYTTNLIVGSPASQTLARERVWYNSHSKVVSPQSAVLQV